MLISGTEFVSCFEQAISSTKNTGSVKRIKLVVDPVKVRFCNFFCVLAIDERKGWVFRVLVLIFKRNVNL